MKYIFASILASEIEQYLHLLSVSGQRICGIQSSLRDLDKFLVSNDLTNKVLEAETVTAWLKTRNVSSCTKALNVAHVRKFVKYLVSLNIDASCPENPKSKSSYIPYVFSDAELERIFLVADNFKGGIKLTRSALTFPILLRLLYGCGLRLGEGCLLRWKDVELENGIITIREAKNLKQRFVPLDDSMTAILRIYREMTLANGICEDYLFESDKTSGKPFAIITFYIWFVKVLNAANIYYLKHNSRDRGPCPHCLRHCFTLKSFLKSEDEGRRFEDTAPFLASYLGQDSPKELEAYLRSSHTVYKQSHQRVNAAIGHLFPEVNFDED